VVDEHSDNNVTKQRSVSCNSVLTDHIHKLFSDHHEHKEHQRVISLCLSILIGHYLQDVHVSLKQDCNTGGRSPLCSWSQEMADVLSNRDVSQEYFADGSCSRAQKETRLLCRWLPHVTQFSQNQHSRIIQSVWTEMNVCSSSALEPIQYHKFTCVGIFRFCFTAPMHYCKKEKKFKQKAYIHLNSIDIYIYIHKIFYKYSKID